MTMQGFVRRISQASLIGWWMFAGADAGAATWSLGSASGHAGDTFDLPLSFTGDGRTVAADITVVLDRARLTIDAPAGELVDAAHAGRCGWNGDGRVGALVFSDSAQALPEGETLVCLLRVRIRPTAPASHVTLHAGAAHCATADGQGGACAVAPGTVEIFGARPEPRPALAESLSLVVLLDATAPSARDVVAMGSEHSVVDALRLRPPRAMRALFAAREPEAATGDTDGVVLQARMARYLVADYESLASRDQARALLLADPLVDGASPDTEMPFAAGGTTSSKALLQQEHVDDLDLQALWLRAGGWGLVGAVDAGITAEHPELRSFTGEDSTSGTWVPGGNYLPYFSSNLGLNGQPASNLSETQPALPGPLDTCGEGFIETPVAGHGTHVAGLIAANATNESGVVGSCNHCGLGMRKTSTVGCVDGVGPVIRNFSTNVAAAIGVHILEGVQIINLSMASFRQYCHYIDGDVGVAAVCDLPGFLGPPIVGDGSVG